VKLDTIENHVLTFGSKIDAVSRDLETIGAQIHSVDSNVLSMDPKLDGLKSQLELEFKGMYVTPVRSRLTSTRFSTISYSELA
jgi:hypothetical protein